MDLEEGSIYYARQRERLARRAHSACLPEESVIGAFVALSPNQNEKTNYNALDLCIKIHLGQLPQDARVSAYPLNRAKALRILSGENPRDILGGKKVRAFYFNTLDPEKSTEVTVDGHMKNAWLNRPGVTLKDRRSNINDTQYERIAQDFREAAFVTCTKSTDFQATVWLTWKRINRILWDPQISFEF